MGFRPRADGYIISNDLYLPEGRFNDTPILPGHTSDEAASMGGRENVTPEDFKKQIKSQYGPHADAILSAYPHSTDAEATKASRGVRNESGFALVSCDLAPADLQREIANPAKTRLSSEIRVLRKNCPTFTANWGGSPLEARGRPDLRHPIRMACA